MRDVVDLVIFGIFIFAVVEVFLGRTVGLFVALPAGSYLATQSIREFNLEKQKALWILKRAAIAGVVVIARRIKSGHWF